MMRQIVWRAALFVVGIVVAFTLLAAFLASGNARAESPQALAQECADSLARRNRLDHQGFGNKGLRCVDRRGRCNRGSGAEVVAYGYQTEAETMAQWHRSKTGHAEIVARGNVSVASAVSRSGRRYWCGVVPG